MPEYDLTISLPPVVFDSEDTIKWLMGGAMHFLSGQGVEKVEHLMQSVMVHPDKQVIRIKVTGPDSLKLFATIMLLVGTMTGVRGAVQRGDGSERGLEGMLSGWGLDIFVN